MSKLKDLFKRIPKSKGLLALSGVIAAVLIPTAIFAWGPSRTTYTIEHPADHVTFNSITNNPAIGDERNFMQIKEDGASNSTYADSITLQPGKTYDVFMYYHNNAATNYNASGKGVAQGAYVKADVPALVPSGKNTSMVGYVGASNASPKEVWDDVVLKQNTGGEIALRLVPGSAKIYNQGKTDGMTLSNNIVTSNGAPIGFDSLNGILPGCNEYAGYVVFKLVADQPNFTVTKQVRINDGTTGGWKDSVSAKPGDTLDYLIQYKNTGTTQQNDVVIKDILPSGLTYVKGSTTLFTPSHPAPTGMAASDNVTTSTGINIGSYAPGASASVRFSAKIPAEDALKCGTNTFHNVGRVETNNGAKQDTADTTVPKDCQPEETKDFTINKTVRKAGTSDAFSENITVNPGDKVEYQIVFKNTGDTTLTNVVIKDTLPKGVTYVTGTTKVDGTSVGDGVTTASGINIGSVAAGATKTITFTAQTPDKDALECGKTVLHNIASAKPAELPAKEDPADVDVDKDCEQKKDFTIDKTVRKAGTKDKFVENVTVKPGDTVEYQIVVKNTGETTLTNVLVKDALPAGMTYVNGTTKVDGASVADGVIGNGITIASIEAGKSVIITFNAKVPANDALQECGDNKFHNVASAKPEGLDPKEDPADTVVPKDCEPTPEPKYICKALTANPTTIVKGGKIKFTVIGSFSGDKVSIKQYKIDYGDVQTATQYPNNVFTHSYGNAGSYTAQAWITYDVNGESKTVTSDDCKVSFKVKDVEPCPWNPNIPKDDPKCVPPTPVTPVTPGGTTTTTTTTYSPSTIAATGSTGWVIGGAVGAGALALGIHSWLSSRRVLRDALKR